MPKGKGYEMKGSKRGKMGHKGKVMDMKPKKKAKAGKKKT